MSTTTTTTQTSLDVEELSASMVREYLSRKGHHLTLKSFEDECPRNERSINSRQTILTTLGVEELWRKNKESSQPYRCVLDVLTKFVIDKSVSSSSQKPSASRNTKSSQHHNMATRSYFGGVEGNKIKLNKHSSSFDDFRPGAESSPGQRIMHNNVNNSCSPFDFLQSKDRPATATLRSRTASDDIVIEDMMGDEYSSIAGPGGSMTRASDMFTHSNPHHKKKDISKRSLLGQNIMSTDLAKPNLRYEGGISKYPTRDAGITITDLKTGVRYCHSDTPGRVTVTDTSSRITPNGVGSNSRRFSGSDNRSRNRPSLEGRSTSGDSISDFNFDPIAPRDVTSTSASDKTDPILSMIIGCQEGTVSERGALNGSEDILKEGWDKKFTRVSNGRRASMERLAANEGRALIDGRTQIEGRPANEGRVALEGRPANEGRASVEGRSSTEGRTSIERRASMEGQTSSSSPSESDRIEDIGLTDYVPTQKETISKNDPPYDSRKIIDAGLDDESIHRNQSMSLEETLERTDADTKTDGKCGDLAIADLDDGDISDTDGATTLPIMFKEPSKSFSSRPITSRQIIDVKILLFGSAMVNFSREWTQQALPFSKSVPYGITQNRGGPCGLLASVQACFLRRLIFQDEVIPTKSALQPSDQQRNRFLAESLADIIWRAGENERAIVTVPTMKPIRVTGKFKCDGLTENLHIYEFDNYDNLLHFMMSSIQMFIDGYRSSCILLLYSVIFTRQVERIKSEMDEVNGKLIGAHGYCTQEMVNLILTGEATSNVFNDVIELDEGGCKTILTGVARRSTIGLLSLYEHYKSCQVGSNYKTPLYPIWIVCSESHFTVLFSMTRQLLRDWKSERRFDLWYYDGLARQTQDIHLSIDTTRFYEKPSEDELVPPLEHCIRTKWADAVIDWNDTDPLL